jgi:hypothetical protein
MKLQVVLLGALICLAAQSADQPSQVTPAHKSAAREARSLTGCIDEQDGQYVLLDDQMLKMADLQSTGSDNDVFAKHVGRMVRVRGTNSSERKGTFRVTGIERVAGDCGQVK